MKLNKLFFIKQFAENTFYCFYSEWTIKTTRIFGISFMRIKRLGYGVEAFGDKKEAVLFVRSKKQEYLQAKKYIKH